MRRETFEIRTLEQLHRARRAVLERAKALEFSAIDSTKLVTAASELGRNAMVHGQGGTMSMCPLRLDGRIGLQLVFEDRGPGIADIGQAMTDGFTTAKSLGLGLGGARRLVSDFSIESQPGQGTRVTVVLWKRR